MQSHTYVFSCAKSFYFLLISFLHTKEVTWFVNLFPPFQILTSNIVTLKKTRFIDFSYIRRLLRSFVETYFKNIVSKQNLKSYCEKKQGIDFTKLCVQSKNLPLHNKINGIQFHQHQYAKFEVWNSPNLWAVIAKCYLPQKDLNFESAKIGQNNWSRKKSGRKYKT